VALTRGADEVGDDGAVGSNQITMLSQNAMRTRNHMSLLSKIPLRFGGMRPHGRS
jgi:hypothetical protein